MRITSKRRKGFWTKDLAIVTHVSARVALLSVCVCARFSCVRVYHGEGEGGDWGGGGGCSFALGPRGLHKYVLEINSG